MKLHREGYSIIAVGLLILGAIQGLNFWLFSHLNWLWLFLLISLGVLVMAVLIIQFFRVPKRTVDVQENEILCPADGKVVAIEEVEEPEYFKDKRIQVSIFMSPLNVHANFNPISGEVSYAKYHPGLFLVAWHPKSSTDNERTTFVIKHKTGQEVLFRQIAGAVARRICYYIQKGDQVEVGKEFGFIKFGSRVDLLLPVSANIKVKIGDKVTAQKTIIGSLD